MRLESGTNPIDPSSVTDIRLDRIGGTGDGLWWVALGFADGRTKPEGMFTNRGEAEQLANELSAAWRVEVKVRTEF